MKSCSWQSTTSSMDLRPRLRGSERPTRHRVHTATSPVDGTIEHVARVAQKEASTPPAMQIPIDLHQFHQSLLLWVLEQALVVACMLVNL
mmetsp:Transcript_12335/g.26682  ORF Transcript_12335/g.26682 Transcript_12335/m.26682 type:complete len:90 (+) Transcript_12335:474-743(+)